MTELSQGDIVRGAILPEPIRVIATVTIGDSTKIIGAGLTTGQVHQPVGTARDLTSGDPV
jgi:hypothetical protein